MNVIAPPHPNPTQTKLTKSIKKRFSLRREYDAQQKQGEDTGFPSVKFSPKTNPQKIQIQIIVLHRHPHPRHAWAWALQ